MINHNTVILSLLVAARVQPLSLLPENLMLEAGEAKVPVYYNALNLLRSTVLDSSVYNINITTAILVVLFNVILGERKTSIYISYISLTLTLLAFFVGRILHDVGRSRKFDDSDWTSLGCLISQEEDRLSCLAR